MKIFKRKKFFVNIKKKFISNISYEILRNTIPVPKTTKNIFSSRKTMFNLQTKFLQKKVSEKFGTFAFVEYIWRRIEKNNRDVPSCSDIEFWKNLKYTGQFRCVVVHAIRVGCHVLICEVYRFSRASMSSQFAS